MRTQTYLLTLHGTGRFPIDMLRYSQAYPITTIDAEQIAESHSASYSPRIKRTIRVGFTGSGGTLLNAIDRFESFGWKSHLPAEEIA